jgi:hypothetical protein
MLAMNLTFSNASKAASVIASNAVSKRSYPDSQLFNWEPVHTATAAVVGRFNPNNSDNFNFNMKQNTLSSDSQNTIVMDVFEAKKSRILRFCLICAYVATIWALKRLQKKALLEGSKTSHNVHDICGIGLDRVDLCCYMLKFSACIETC